MPPKNQHSPGPKKSKPLTEPEPKPAVEKAKTSATKLQRFKNRVRRYLIRSKFSVFDDRKPESGLIGLFSTWGRVARALVLTGGVTLILLLGIKCLPWAASKAEVSITESGALKVSIPGKNQQWLTSVPASDLWVNTGIKIPPSHSVRIRAWGRANLAIHRLVAAAYYDQVPYQCWVNPDGVILGSNGAKVPYNDKEREELLLFPASKNNNVSQTGLLVGCLVPTNTSNGKLPSKENPRPEFRLFAVGSSSKIDNNDSTACELWLCINDAILDPKNLDTCRRIYIASVRGELNKNDNPFVKFMETAEDRWDNIVKNRYWNLWYDDNFGEYQVSCVLE